MTVHQFRVRWYQESFHRALVDRTHDRLFALWHRRAGKDEIVLNGMRTLALKDPGTYWHCFPEQKQARKAIWNGVNGHTGKRRIHEAFPESIIKRMQDDDMFIELKNGATFQLIGSDRYDSTVGSGPKGISYSEWALSDPAAWAYHSPMIRESGGFAAFITTPRGKNHAKKMFDRAETSDDWFSQRLTVRDTGALTSIQLAEALNEYIDLHGEDLGRALFEQEYMCSFEGAIIGAYYASSIAAAKESGRLGFVGADPLMTYRAVWDIGGTGAKADSTAVWIVQYVGDEVRILDYYEAVGQPLSTHVSWLRDRGYEKALCVLPHDGVQHDKVHKTSYESALKEANFQVRVIKNQGPGAAMMRVNAARRLFPSIRFNGESEDVMAGVEALKSYHEKKHEKTGIGLGPNHDWSSHAADAFGLIAIDHKTRPTVKKPAGKFKAAAVV